MKKGNPAIIGLFILIGLGLGITALLLVSSSRIFVQTSTYILYFDSALTGLDPGTAVKYRGVTIGSVKEILLHYNQAGNDTALPVIIEINQDLLQKKAHGSINLADEADFRSAIERGLRGRLEPQSLLTGLLYVNLDFLPESPTHYHQLTPEMREIPTAPVEVQLFQVDFSETTKKLNTVLAKLDTSIAQMNPAELNSELTNLLTSLSLLAKSPQLTNTLASARAAFDEFAILSRHLQTNAHQLSIASETTLRESDATLREVRAGVQDLRDLLAPDAALRQDLDNLLKDLSESARSISELADFLKAHPNALLSGRKPAKP